VLVIPGTLVRRWKLTIEFTDAAGDPVTPATRDIDWTRPWFRVHGAHLPVPAFGPRPRAQAFAPGAWYQTEINCA
jgi:hypothetical protein